MKALQLVARGRSPELRDVPIPKPGPGQVLIKVAAAGACHSDLHLIDRPPLGPSLWRFPFTLGHENAGWVYELGAGVEGLNKGDAVLVYGPWGCGSCRPCRLGRENYCDRAAAIPAAGGGLGLDGGMAEYMLVPSARLLVGIGALDPVKAAPLADAALTPYHAIKPLLGSLHPGSTSVVIGVGGLGFMTVQLLKALSKTRIIAVDKNDMGLERARGAGADIVIKGGVDAAEEVRTHNGGLGVELVLDMVGSEDSLALGAKLLRREGSLVVVGLDLGTLPFNFFTIPYGARISTSYWGTVTELMEVVTLAQKGQIGIEVERFPIDRAAEAYDRLRAGQIRGRAVVVP